MAHACSRHADKCVRRSDDDDEAEATAAAATGKNNDETPASREEGGAAAEDAEAVAEPDKAAKLDKELRQYTVAEIADFDVKILKAKIAALEGEFSGATASAIAQF